MTFLSRFYYDLKPFLPLRMRMALRRLLVQRLVKKSGHIWPINPAAARKPEGWTGWPEGKQFALVLTHDVEGRSGLARCRDVMNLERELGFRSSFNFIPEGEYATPPELRHELIANGFEVGVHDLHHNGKLYRSRKDFERAALRINKYLHEWNAVGFRSGFMHHRLDWLHLLDIEYDMSTFDTDPFEPQPDGVDTIFPFWVSAPEASPVHNPQSTVPGPRSTGYIEMPYTLPQDSTLFLFLLEQTTAIWEKKLEWIARHGGVALLNLHPDYISFDSGAPSRTYPARLYRDFLEHILSKYSGQFWHATPAEAARHVRDSSRLAQPISGRRVCMLSYSFYESDNRVMRYAEALAQRGDAVDVFALAAEPDSKETENLRGVTVHRIQHRQRNEKGKISYLIRLLRFLLVGSYHLTRRQLRSPYDVVHVHNVPDFLVFAAWFPKLKGARILLDIHDILPEFYASKFNTPSDAHYVSALKWLERISCRFADHVIISNHLWYDTITARSVPPSRCTPIINYVDTALFYPRRRTRQDGRFIAIFPGGLQWHQGLDIAIRAFATVRQHLPHAEFHIYGDGKMKQSLLQLRDELGLHEAVHIFKPLPLPEIAEIIANADVGLVPKRADSFGNQAFSTKIMEFMSQGIPVIASRTKIDSYYFDDTVLRFFPSGDAGALAAEILNIAQNPGEALRLRDKALSLVQENSWERKKHDYFALVDGSPVAPVAFETGLSAPQTCDSEVLSA